MADSNQTSKLVCIGDDGDNTCQIALSSRDLIVTLSTFFALLTAHAALTAFLRPRIKGTVEKSKSPRAGVTSVQILCLLSLIELSLHGIVIMIVWPFEGSSVEERVYKYDEMSADLTRIMCGYQMFAFAMAFVYEYLGRPAYVIHHGVVIIVALVTFRPYILFYAFFFFGVVEFSSVFVGIIELFKTNSELITTHKRLYELVRILFAISFLVLRVLAWPVVLFGFMVPDVVWAMKHHRDSHGHRPFIFNALVMVLGGSGLLVLQLFWAVKIVEALVKKMSKKNKQHTRLNGDEQM